jgi:hypothetical protein
MVYNCKICGQELDVETYRYIAWGGMAQGPLSDKGNYTEETFCINCFTTLKANLLVMISRAISEHNRLQADPKHNAL